MNTAYDQVPYLSYAYPDSHPDHIAVVARLMGMTPPPVEHCRVLEIGCASGGNLIPMAYGLPNSEFLGVDLSKVQISAGQEVIRKLELKNIHLEVMDIMDLAGGTEKFDYIIAHGVYSWVPDLVRMKLMEIIAHNLSENGAAFVSFNAYPGWHNQEIVRDMLRYHVRNTADPKEKVDRARAWLRFMANNIQPDETHFNDFIKLFEKKVNRDEEGAGGIHDSFLLHDHLEESNHPVYFYEFMEQAQQAGLQYVGDSEFETMMVEHLPAEVAKTLEAASTSSIELEQYMDFWKNRSFRRSILCHQKNTLSRLVSPSTIKDFYCISNAASADANVDYYGDGEVVFHAVDGAKMSLTIPIVKTAFQILNEKSPRMVSFWELLKMSQARLHSVDDGKHSQQQYSDEDLLASGLLKAFSYSSSLVDFSTCGLSGVDGLSVRPRASRLARLQALEGSMVVNLRHRQVNLDEVNRLLIGYLDGERDLPSVIRLFLDGPVAQGKVDMQMEGLGALDFPAVRGKLVEIIAQRLYELAYLGLMEA